VAGLASGPAKVTLGKDPTDTWSPASEIKEASETASSSTTAELATKAVEQVAKAILSNAAALNSSGADGLLSQSLKNPVTDELKTSATATLGKPRL
jgi:type VI secretion system secreted protein VgrG